MRFKEVYKRLNGREATTEQVLKFERLVASLETTSSDAMLSVLVALDHYENLYSEIPQKINVAVEKSLIEFNGAAKNQAVAALASAKADLSDAVNTVAQQVASDVSQKQKWQWASGSIIVSMICVGAFGLLMKRQGQEAGYNNGYSTAAAAAKDEKAAASWANSPQGQQALKLAQSGNLDRLIHCNGKGWKIEKGFCYVNPAPDGLVYGWRLP